MAPTTAVCFLLAGAALVLIDLTTRAGHRPADWLVLAGAALPLVALLGYIFQARFFYTIGAANPMALNSAAAMLLLCLGVLVARPDRGLMAMITGGSAGGVVLRTLLPAAVGVPVALGVLRMMGQRLGLFDAQVGLSLFTLSAIVVLVVLVWWNAGLLHRLDLRRRQAEDDLRRAHDELERRVEDRTAELQDANRSLTREIAERRKAQAALTHLNAVLRSIQHINQLVIREQDAAGLAWR
ncbi:MAG: hypothetical protein NT031_12155, partial [Planctomycetota bacterium]|nr:hypothetical protein [Planctomycetota bacterium]